MKRKRGAKKNRAKRASSRTAGNGKPNKRMYQLQLYVTGQTPRSVASVRNIQHLCHDYLAGRFELKIVDIYQQPEMAREAQIIAAPTLVKRLPLPLRRLVGDLSSEQKVLLALDLKPEKAADEIQGETQEAQDAQTT